MFYIATTKYDKGNSKNILNFAILNQLKCTEYIVVKLCTFHSSFLPSFLQWSFEKNLTFDLSNKPFTVSIQMIYTRTHVIERI